MKRKNLLVNVLSLQSLEGSNWHIVRNGVQLVLGVLFIIAETSETNTNTGGNTMNSLGPDGLVELAVDAHIFSAHELLGGLANHLDGMRTTLLESAITLAL